jgi:hypothetical protein
MPKYRKKPVIIEAEQFFQDEYDAIGTLPIGACDCANLKGGVHCHTLEGLLTVSHEDWVITGVQGEHYPCKPDIFAATYEPVEEP